MTWFKRSRTPDAGHWYEEKHRFERESRALKSLGVETRIDDEEQVVATDRHLDGVELRVVYPIFFPRQRPAVIIERMDFPEVFAALSESGLVSPAGEVHWSALHPWRQNLTGAHALVWSRDILLVAVLLVQGLAANSQPAESLEKANAQLYEDDSPLDPTGVEEDSSAA